MENKEAIDPTLFSDLQGRVEQLEAVLKDKNREIYSLKEEKENLESENKDLQEKVESLEEENAQYQDGFFVHRSYLFPDKIQEALQRCSDYLTEDDLLVLLENAVTAKKQSYEVHG